MNAELTTYNLQPKIFPQNYYIWPCFNHWKKHEKQWPSRESSVVWRTERKKKQPSLPRSFSSPH